MFRVDHLVQVIECFFLGRKKKRFKQSKKPIIHLCTNEDCNRTIAFCLHFLQYAVYSV